LGFYHLNVATAKNIVYRYSNSWDEEVEVDLAGALTFAKGDMVYRGGKVWKVDSITLDFDVAGGNRLPILWVNLTEMRVN